MHATWCHVTVNAASAYKLHPLISASTTYRELSAYIGLLFLVPTF